MQTEAEKEKKMHQTKTRSVFEFPTVAFLSGDEIYLSEDEEEEELQPGTV